MFFELHKIPTVLLILNCRRVLYDRYLPRPVVTKPVFSYAKTSGDLATSSIELSRRLRAHQHVKQSPCPPFFSAARLWASPGAVLSARSLSRAPSAAQLRAVRIPSVPTDRPEPRYANVKVTVDAKKDQHRDPAPGEHSKLMKPFEGTYSPRRRFQRYI